MPGMRSPSPSSESTPRFWGQTPSPDGSRGGRGSAVHGAGDASLAECGMSFCFQHHFQPFPGDEEEFFFFPLDI